MEGEEEGQGGPKDLEKEGERDSDVGKKLPEDLVNQGDQVDQEGEKGTRLRGKTKAGLILGPLLDPLAAAVNRFDSVQL